MLSSKPEHLAKRQQDFYDDQYNDVPLDTKGTAGLNQPQQRLHGPRNQFQLAVQGRESLDDLEFVTQAGK